ncbi:MAG TPA: hypothetical protein VM537_15325 [Anaerolineae bacterium]|nr:hypothetical protein [Anaerolineae bacterium]
MARPKAYYYECIGQVDVVYMAPDHRRERWSGMTQPIVQHSYRFVAADPDAGTPANIMVTERKVAPYFTDPIVKKVRRKNLRTGESEIKEKVTKVPFRLLERWEVTESVMKRAISLNLPEQCYSQAAEVDEEVMV